MASGETTIEDVPVGAKPDADELRGVRATLEAVVPDRSLLALLSAAEERR